MTASSLPVLPLTCLTTAEELSTQNAFQGQTTVIDFWTTKCTRCPEALDKLDAMATEPKYSNINFVSICCDKLDGAREILEGPDTPRWNHLSHFFMDQSSKEQAKREFGFKSVPFYVVLDERGKVMQKGSKLNVDAIPGIVVEKENINRMTMVEKNVMNVSTQKAQERVNAERVFTLDEDF